MYEGLLSDVNDSSLDDFLLEAEAMFNIRHENILHLLGLALIEEVFYMILEVKGQGDLQSYLMNPQMVKIAILTGFLI